MEQVLVPLEYFQYLLENCPSCFPFDISACFYFAAFLFLLTAWWAHLGFSWEKVTVRPIKESYEEVLYAPEASVSVAFQSKLLWHLHAGFSGTAINKAACKRHCVSLFRKYWTYHRILLTCQSRQLYSAVLRENTIYIYYLHVPSDSSANYIHFACGRNK